MPEYPYITSQKPLREFLSHIQRAGPPEDKVTQKYLQSVGFKSSAYRGIIPVLKSIGFLDPSGQPTGTWNAYRDKKTGKEVLAVAIRGLYKGLFQRNPRAPAESTDNLVDFFKVQGHVSESTAAFMVATFKTLCSAARLEEGTGIAEVTPTVPVPHPAVGVESPTASAPRVSGPEIHIDLHIHVPEGATPEQIDRIFAGIGKNILGRE